ncbi:MAG: biotin--[acetyl-CoA-carboxylase] ligase [Eubacterium sp.]|nr:biotin--[acetyl-CoA-carboxylase] ligase [Eubacterium sp.]
MKELDLQPIHEILSAAGIHWNLYYAESVDSTNDWAKRTADGIYDPVSIEGRSVLPRPEEQADRDMVSVFLADHQTAGKGRKGNVWKSPEFTSVSMSILLYPDIPAERFALLTLVMGLAACQGFREVSGLDIRIKWPNDIVFSGRKMSGILTEMGPAANYVVIGIGLNVNIPDFPEQLKEKATSLFMECGKKFKREEVTAEVLKKFGSCLARFLAKGNLSDLLEDYRSLLINRGKRVRVLDPGGAFTGTAVDVDENGRLLVRSDETEEIIPVSAGEVSVRGIYGYV